MLTNIIEYVLIGVDILALLAFILLFFRHNSFTDFTDREMSISLTVFFVLTCYLFHDSKWYNSMLSAIRAIPLPVWGIASIAFAVRTVLIQCDIIDSSPFMYYIHFAFVLIVTYCFIIASNITFWMVLGIALYVLNEVLLFKILDEVYLD